MHRAARLIPLAVVTALAACAAADIRTDIAAHEGAKSCCASVQALPPHAGVQSSNELKFGPHSPHFDFGLGLAPFATFRVDPTKIKYVALLSSPKGSGLLFGGDGTSHYADLRVIYIDQSGQQLVAELTPPVVRSYGPLGTFMLARYATVPGNAAIAVVTTNTKDVGRRSSATGSVGDGGMMLGSVFIPLPGGTKAFPFTLSMYGDGLFLAGDTPPRPR